MKLRYMEYINVYFENAKLQSLVLMRKDQLEYQTLGKLTYVKNPRGDWEDYIPNIREFNLVAKTIVRNEYFKKGHSAYPYTLKPNINFEDLTDFQKDCLIRMNNRSKKKIEIIDRYPAKMISVVKNDKEFNESKAIELLNEFYEIKKQDLLKKVESKGGKIIDALELYRDLEEFNGTFRCENGLVKVQTIIAGGYNIQCLHVRTLVKKLK